MKKSILKIFLTTFLAVLSITVINAYTAPTNTPPNSNTKPPMDETSDSNYKYDAGLSLVALTTGTNAETRIASNGNVAVNSSANPPSDVRLYVNGDVRSSSLVGTGERYLCSSTTNQSSTGGGYPIVVCP